MKFIGREYELNTLERLYEANTFQFVVMYVRRTAQMKIELLTFFIK